jgi:predicted phosphodiesterase
MKTLIIPDVHGRTFWKKAIEKHKDEVNKIIFLGDYLDPYPWEGITRKEAIRNFQEIIISQNLYY